MTRQFIQLRALLYTLCFLF